MYNQTASTVVDSVIVIDWSKGPSDAQYYSPETDSNYESFAKIEDGFVYFVDNQDWLEWRKDWFQSESDLLNDPEMIKKEQ